VRAFHKQCVQVNLQAANVHKREMKASLHYVRLSENLRKMSQAENSKGLRASLIAVCDAMSEIETHRENLVVSRISSTLQNKLKELDTTCNQPTKLLLKDRNASVQSSLKFKDQFEALASNSTTPQRTLDKKKLQLDAFEKRVYTIDRGLQQALLKYEERRAKEMRLILEDYIKGQLLFHCRAVESLSKALKQVTKLDSNDAVEQLCNDLHISAKQLNFEKAP
jgi:hypothetical protein